MESARHGARAGTAAVRRARRDDAEHMLALSLAAIRVSAAGHYTEAQRQAWAARRTLTDHRRWVQDTVALVAELDGEVVGFATLIVERHELDQLYVAPAAGGRGVARALLEAVHQEAVVAGLTRLDARASWRSLPVFERLGWERVALERVLLDGIELTRTHVRTPLDVEASARLHHR